METVLLLGGTRFIGPAIIERLMLRGARVVAFHRGVNRAELPPGVEERLGDRDEAGVVGRLVAELRPCAVIDTWAMTEESASGTLDELSGWDGKLVMLSSCDVYRNFGGVLGVESEPPSPTPITEDSPLRSGRYPYRTDPPRSQTNPQAWRDRYDKIPVERMYLERGALVLRLPMVFGPGDYQHRMAVYLRRMLDARPFILLASELADFVFPRGYIENVAEAVAVAAESPIRSGIFNVADAIAYRERDWVQAIGDAMGWAGEIRLLPQRHLPEDLSPGFDLAYGLEISAARIRKELGVREVCSADEAIRRCAEWERENMPEVKLDYAVEDALVSELANASDDIP